MTPPQIRFLQTARRQIVPEEADYRLALRNICGAASCKDLTQAGFEDFLAFLESCGWRDQNQHANFWRDLVNNRGLYASRRQLWTIEQTSLKVKGYEDIPGLIRHLTDQQSRQRTSEPSKLRPREAEAVIEALKQIARRERENNGSRRGAEAQRKPNPNSSASLAPLREPIFDQTGAAEIDNDLPF